MAEANPLRDEIIVSIVEDIITAPLTADISALVLFMPHESHQYALNPDVQSLARIALTVASTGKDTIKIKPQDIKLAEGELKLSRLGALSLLEGLSALNDLHKLNDPNHYTYQSDAIRDLSLAVAAIAILEDPRWFMTHPRVPQLDPGFVKIPLNTTSS